MDINRMQGVIRQMMEIHKDFTSEEIYVLKASFEALEIMKRLDAHIRSALESNAK